MVVVDEKRVIDTVLLNFDCRRGSFQIAARYLELKKTSFSGEPLTSWRLNREYIVEASGDILLVSRMFYNNEMIILGRSCSRSFDATEELGDNALTNNIYFSNNYVNIRLNEWGNAREAITKYIILGEGGDDVVDDWGVFRLEERRNETIEHSRSENNNNNNWPRAFDTHPKHWAGIWVTAPIWWCLKQYHEHQTPQLNLLKHRGSFDVNRVRRATRVPRRSIRLKVRDQITAIKPLHKCLYIMAADPVLPDQKKRTMEALERRFALAEAQHIRQQPSYKKRPHEEDNKPVAIINSPSVSLIKPFTHPPAKKGHFASSGQSATQDAEANGPTYFRLTHHVHDNLLRNSSELADTSKSVVNKVLHELLQSGDSAEKYLQGSKTKKVDNCILLDNLDKGRGASLAARLKALQKHSKRSKKHMSMKQLKKNGAYDLPQELHNFDYFKPMHELWKGYLTKLIKNVGKNQLAQCLLSADLHGAMLLVVHCKVDSYTGLNGIVIRETAETFGIMTHENKFRVVPKKPSVFILQVDCWKITLHGDKLASRSIGS